MARLLIAEDDSVNQQVLLRLLARLGHSAMVVGTGMAAVAAVRAAYSQGDHFDVIFMDMQMPELDGLSAIQMIRRLPLGFPPYIVGISADQAISPEFDAALSKPFQLAHLKELLTAYLAAYYEPALLETLVQQYGPMFALSLVQTAVSQMETYPLAIATAAYQADPLPLRQLSAGLQAAGLTLGTRALTVAIDQLVAASPYPPDYLVQRLSYQISATRGALQQWLRSRC